MRFCFVIFNIFEDSRYSIGLDLYSNQFIRFDSIEVFIEMVGFNLLRGEGSIHLHISM